MNAPGTVVGLLSPEDLQRNNEYYFCRKHINGYIEEAIRESPRNQVIIADGVKRVSQWLDHWFAPWTDQTPSEKRYNSKHARLTKLQSLDLVELVTQIFVGISYFQVPTQFVNATGQLAAHLNLGNRRDSIETVAELCAVLCWTGAFTLGKREEDDVMMLHCHLPLPESILDAIARSAYPPPMVCAPKPVKSNYESPYLTFDDCRILGKHNGHSDDICLDVINTQAAVPLQLNTQFLSTVEEEPTFELDTPLKIREWHKFKCESYTLYSLMVRQGNLFFLDQRVDKRGRLYSQGYHINTQGSSFKKAMIELANTEIVEGVPI